MILDKLLSSVGITARLSKTFLDLMIKASDAETIRFFYVSSVDEWTKITSLHVYEICQRKKFKPNVMAVE